MKTTYPFLIGFALAASAIAQNIEKPDLSESVQKAIDEFNRLKAEGREKLNEVKVVLEPPAPVAIEVDEDVPEPKTKEEDGAATPQLVTGKPPAADVETEAAPEETADAPIAEEPEPEPEPEAEPEAEPEPEPEPEAKKPGLEVRVESIRKGTGEIDPTLVQLKAGFPAKPLSTPPNGWVLEKSELAPAFRKEVTLQPGTVISLSIIPHVLAPDSDGLNTFSVNEPGFEVPRGYRQENTVSAILGRSVAQLDHDALQLGNAISELHRLLASLPKSEETPTEEPKKP